MSCSGLHCAACSGGAAVPVVPIAAFLGAGWVAQHLIEVAAVSGACGALSVAAVVALTRWGDRREARHAASRSIWTVRADPAVSAGAAGALPSAARPELPGVTINCNFYGADADGEQVAARVIRQAITGQSGDTTPPTTAS